MKTPDVIIVHPSSEDKFQALKAVMKALKIDFEIPKKNSPYNTEFVNMVLQGDKDLKNGKGKKTSLKELDNLWK